jgi:hypothetical protein
LIIDDYELSVTAPSGDEGGIPRSATSFNLFLTKLRETETEIQTETELTTTDDDSSTHSENFSQVRQSTDSLSDLSQCLSGLTLAPGNPRRGQFGYRPEGAPFRLPYTLSPASFSTSTLSTSPSSLSSSPTGSQSFLDQLPRYNTPGTSLPPIPVTTNSSDDEDMPQPTFFYGDGRSDDLVPGDFIKTIINTFKETSMDSFKVQRLQNGLATNSVAEQWFDDLPPATRADWDLVEAQFKLRWPKEVLVAETIEKRRRKLRNEKLLKDDIGVMVMANGVEMSGQARWASKIQTLSAQADDPSGALIHSVWNEMPQIMKKLVKSSYPTWPEFSQAVKDVSEEDIETAMTEERRIMALERDAKALRAQITLQSPTAPLRASFSGFNIGRGGNPTGAAVPDADVFQGGAMANNNIMRGFQTPSRGRGFSRGGPAVYRANHLRHADLSANTLNMLHHPNTPQGRTDYALQITAWKTANPTKYSGGDEFAPYPLTPGTEAVGKGECFECGYHHGRTSPHSGPILDPGESYYRRVANRIIRESRAEANEVPVGVRFVAATDDYPSHWVSTADSQGNGGGLGA